MIDQLAFYADLAVAFAAGGLVMGLIGAIGNSFAKIGITFRPDRDERFLP